MTNARALALTAIFVLGMLGCGGGGSKEQAQGEAPAPKEEAPQVAGGSQAQAEQPVGDRSHEEIPQPRETAPPARVLRVPAGTEIVVSLDQSLSTETATAGQPFSGRTTEPVEVDGATAIPAGSTVHGEVIVAKRAPNVGGRAKLTLSFGAVELPNGKRYPVSAETLYLEGESTTKGDVEKVVGGALGGAIIGGILGGKSGAVKGAAAGTAVGGVVAVATKGNDIVLDPGTKVGMTLEEDVGITVTGSL